MVFPDMLGSKALVIIPVSAPSKPVEAHGADHASVHSSKALVHEPAQFLLVRR